MPTDYSKKKNAELEDLLKSRSLPHTGKKAELVARLQQYDAEQAKITSSSSTSKPPPTAPAPAEDEIDWEDDAGVASTEPGAAAIAAGGLVQPPNPTKVPNQVIDTDPSKTDDLTIDPPAPVDATKATNPAQSTEPAKPAVDFTSGLSTTSLDHEIAQRAKRAARFGIQESNEDAKKALERAKKFGTGGESDKSAVKGLDQALPERMAKGQKRGRGGEDGDARGEGRRDGAGKRSRVRGPKNGREGSGPPRDGVKKPGSGLSEEDRLAAEARKKKFAAMG